MHFVSCVSMFLWRLKQYKFSFHLPPAVVPSAEAAFGRHAEKQLAQEAPHGIHGGLLLSALKWRNMLWDRSSGGMVLNGLEFGMVRGR